MEALPPYSTACKTKAHLSVVVVIVVQLQQLVPPMLLQRLVAAGGIERDALQQVAAAKTIKGVNRG